MPASVHQVVAAAFVYRRILQAWIRLPLFTLCTPLLIRILQFFLNICATADYALLSILLTVTLTMLARMQIYRLATTEKALKIALHRNQIRLPILMFAASCFLSRRYLGPLLDSKNLLTRLHFFGFQALFVMAMRAATTMLFLGIFVAARFVGSTSIVRCSAFPLASIPFDFWIRRLRENPWLLFFEPGESGDLMSPVTFYQQQQKGRRCQRPSLRSVMQHIVLAIITGVATFFICFSQLRGSDSFAQSAIFTICVLAPFWSLMSVILGVSHELDPREYFLEHGRVRKLLEPLRKSTMFSVVWFPPVAMFIGALTSFETPTNVATLYIQLAAIGAIMTAYIFFLDIIIRQSLFRPRCDLKKMVDEIDDATPIAVLRVILRSLLYEPSIINEVWVPSYPMGVEAPERTERLLYDNLAESMSEVLLKQVDPNMELPLEEDILRIAILESFGGRPDSLPNMKGDECHQQAINTWVDQPMGRYQRYNENLAASFVRGFVVYIGGLGRTLQLCTQMDTGSSKKMMWTIPPGALASADYAVHAAARCIIRSLAPDGQALADWKSSTLSVQIPTTLMAIFQLQRGTISYSKYISFDGKKDARAYIAKHDPDLYSVVRLCDQAANSILSRMKTLSGIGRIDLALKSECLEWVNVLMAQGEADQKLANKKTF